MKNEKLDWLKAVKERPEDAAAYIEWAKRLVYETEGFSHPYCASQPLKRLRAAARVQTVEEAASDVAEFVDTLDVTNGKTFDLDKAMTSPAAREIIRRLLAVDVGLMFAVVPDTDIRELQAAARVQSVEEADRAYVDYILKAWSSLSSSEICRLRVACREARAREAAEESK